MTGDRSSPAPPEALRNLCARKPEAPSRIEEVGRDLRRFVALTCDRSHRFRGEFTHRVAYELLVF